MIGFDFPNPRRIVTDQVHKRPWITTGTFVAAGFVLGLFVRGWFG